MIHYLAASESNDGDAIKHTIGKSTYQIGVPGLKTVWISIEAMPWSIWTVWMMRERFMLNGSPLKYCHGSSGFGVKTNADEKVHLHDSVRRRLDLGNIGYVKEALTQN
ncbi:hypothetical protein L6452_35105 [Arctium lappa]|uniref:Uncharacterized protein n=1 Tax=Arctium lappa TaxID=4217 RepID=A0ACB8YJ86_ARCLA|nr:hypothetical protein L6452_35105 [Arctium lappa]